MSGHSPLGWRQHVLRGVDAVGRGSEAAPFKTIQYAVDQASSSSADTIRVQPGIYDEGGKENDNGTPHTNRVMISKRVNLESVGGASVTHIVGAPDPTTGTVGAGAIRCIYTDNDAANSRIIGFTLRDGYGDDGTANHNHRGGGFLQYNGQKYIYLYDCVISNCVAWTHGGGRGGTFVRCRFERNRVTRNHADSGSAVGESNLQNCLIANNGDSDIGLAVKGCTLVNCTVVGNRGTGVSQNDTLYNSIVCGNASADYFGTAAHESVIGGYPIVAPLIGDFHVVSGGPADGIGRTSCYQNPPFMLPDVVASTNDLDGVGIDVQAAHIQAGAFQTTVAVRTGVAVIKGPAECEGRSLPNGCYGFAQGRVGTEQWKVGFAGTSGSGSSTTYAAFVSRRGATTTTGYLDRDNAMWILPPPKPGLVCTNYAAYYKGLWVDPAGTDAPGAGTEAAPYRTIQYAADAAKGNSVIFLNPGTYAEGGSLVENPSVAYNGRIRVCVTNANVRIVGLGGAARTVIVGESDPTTGGCGPDAMRCFFSNGSQVILQGVTLSNGWTRADTGTSGPPTYTYGAAMYGGNLQDGIVTCCCGTGSVFNTASVYRSRVYGNSCAYGSLFDGNTGRAVCSWIGPNRSKSSSYYGYFGSGTAAWFCTMVNDDDRSCFSQVASVYNCVAVGGAFVRAAMAQAGNLFWKFADVEGAARGKFTEANPYLAEDRIHPVSLCSPAATAGVAPSAAGYDAGEAVSKNWYVYASADLEGNPVRLGADGTTMAGAVQTSAPGSCAWIDDENDVLAVVPDAKGAVTLPDGGQLIVSISPTAQRPCIGVTVNGVTNLLSGAESLTIRAADIAGKGAIVRAICTADRYVDAVNGDDAKDGFTPQTAKLTLKGVMTSGTFLPGDVVHAAKGRYDDGKMRFEGHDLDSRVCVPAGVSLVADEGPDVTFIVGASAPAENDLYYGCGTGAVRCVYLDDTKPGTRLRGFTLTDGRAMYYTANVDGKEIHYHVDNTGAGVCAQRDMNCERALVENCVISNCVSFRGSGARYVTLKRCRLCHNRAYYSCAATGDSIMYGSLSHDNDITGPFSHNSVAQMYDVYDSTIADGMGNPRVGYKVYNCILTGMAVQTNGVYHRTFIVEGRGVGDSELLDGSRVVPAAELQLDADCRPVVGANVAIDQANEGYRVEGVWPDDGSDADLTGFRRVMNAKRDCGALEADWGPRYAQDIAGRWLKVDASSMVCESEDGTVIIPDGASLTATWPGRGATEIAHRLVFRVSAGTLTLTVNGERHVFSASPDEQVFEFSSALAQNGLTASVSDDGSAELVSFRRNVGLMLLVR